MAVILYCHLAVICHLVLPRYINTSQYSYQQYDMMYRFLIYIVVFSCAVVKQIASSLIKPKSKLQFFLHVPGNKVSTMISTKNYNILILEHGNKKSP